MTRLLGKLDVLKCPLRDDVSKKIFLQNQKTFSHLTNLNYVLVPSKISQISQDIPQICKNLKACALAFNSSFYTDLSADPSRLSDFKTLIQELPKLPKLQSISICWSGSWSHNLWPNFIPPTSLRSLKLTFDAGEMIKAIFKVSDLWKANLATLKNIIMRENFFD